MEIMKCHKVGGNLATINFWFIIYILGHSSTIKIGVERVNQEKYLVEFAGYIILAGNQQ